MDWTVSSVGEGVALAEELRDGVPGLRVSMNCGGGSFKSQFKKADRSGAAIALVLGDDEIDKAVVSVKEMRREAAQESIARAQLRTWLCSRFEVGYGE